MYLPHVTILLNNGTNKRVSYDTCDDKHWRYNCPSDFSWFRHDYVSVGHENWKYYVYKKMNTYFAVDLFRTLYIKRKTIGRPAHPHLESLRQSRDWKGTFERKKALHALYTRGSASRQRLQRRSKIIERVSSQFFPLVFLFTKYLCYHDIQVDKMYQISK